MTYIPWSSDFALYLEDYLMYEYHYLGLWVCMTEVQPPVILPYILKTIWCMNIIFWHYDSVWPNIWPQNKYRSLWPIFHGPLILCYILKTIWYMNIILWDYRSVWPDIWPQNKCRSMWPIFYGPVILSYISKTIWCMSFIFSDNKTVWLKLDLKVNISQHDLYFMV